MIETTSGGGNVVESDPKYKGIQQKVEQRYSNPVLLCGDAGKPDPQRTTRSNFLFPPLGKERVGSFLRPNSNCS
ncbi:hypothetical protein VNO78_01570 [Psophocarpus tetragonolobus]|uniref:Uncharacterized protein n=1 Tax=Psophocarpus tetragonolobus TaxID=3891 RepID=A0AAN9SYG2_PSOTE